MDKYRKKPVVIEAVRWDGTDETLLKIMRMNVSHPTAQAFCLRGLGNTLTLPTLEGDMRAVIGDWIIKGVKGEFYPCKSDIFEVTYEKLRKEKKMSTERILMQSETMIVSIDEKGPGHANHLYQVRATEDGVALQSIKFQKGPIQEVGVNGIQNEDLLAIVIDRLVGFQTGEYACPENEAALDACILACTHLQKRTAKRKARGVEGKSEK